MCVCVCATQVNILLCTWPALFLSRLGNAPMASGSASWVWPSASRLASSAVALQSGIYIYFILYLKSKKHFALQCYERYLYTHRLDGRHHPPLPCRQFRHFIDSAYDFRHTHTHTNPNRLHRDDVIPG